MTSYVYTPRLRQLRPILQRWVRLNLDLALAWRERKDVPWWYNERASISVLAGAVWKSGGHAFEEYSTKKRGDEDALAHGRSDLYFEFNGYQFTVEAKQCWPAVTQKRDQSEYIDGQMAAAVADTRRCPPQGPTRLAVLFGSPYLSRQHGHEMSDRVEWLKEQASEIKADAIAWTFPELPWVPCHKESLYPGAIVWIRALR